MCEDRILDGPASGEKGSTKTLVKPGFFFFFFFITLVAGRRRSLSLKLSDARVYEPQIRARLGTTVKPGRFKRVERATGVPRS